jgi:hypothetical protein
MLPTAEIAMPTSKHGRKGKTLERVNLKNVPPLTL